MLIALLLSSVLTTKLATAATLDLSEVNRVVEQAARTSFDWDGPTSGPAAATHKEIVFVAADLRNDGINGVAKGVAEAASTIGWQLKFIDGKGSSTRQTAALAKAIAMKPDGVILGGFNAHEHIETLNIAKELGIAAVGWHASGSPGPDVKAGLFSNLTTDPFDVAKLAAYYAIATTDGQAKVVIFTDPNYAIALEKSNTMANIINGCASCEVLSIEHLPLEVTADQMPNTIKRLFDTFGTQITNFLVINDLYIDFAVPSLEAADIPEHQLPVSISAGDGSAAAYARIKQNAYQSATVPEPLTLHGWQAIDELNRAFNGEADSGFTASSHLITPVNIRAHESPTHKDLSTTPAYTQEFKQAYSRIWAGETAQ